MTERILTTHAGSLPRLPELNRLFVARSKGERVDEGELSDLIRQATIDVVAAQARVGIDIAGNGEAGARELLHLCLGASERIRRRVEPAAYGGHGGVSHVPGTESAALRERVGIAGSRAERASARCATSTSRRSTPSWTC